MPGRDHAADAGGDPSVLAAKQELRQAIWDRMSEAGVARFPGAEGRIPNFTGAEDAAERLRGTAGWLHSAAMKANPDSPQWPVRQRALEDGIVVYMAVPRLAGPQPFLKLVPELLDVSARKAASIKGASRYGRPVAVEELQPMGLVVMGCVAVDAEGARLGKGGGFADLEFAIAAAAGLVDEDTLVATTVHPLQLVDPGRIPVTEHDVPVDLVVTPDEVIRCDPRRSRPADVFWEELSEEKIAAIPLLQNLREQA